MELVEGVKLSGYKVHYLCHHCKNNNHTAIVMGDDEVYLICEWCKKKILCLDCVPNWENYP